MDELLRTTDQGIVVFELPAGAAGEVFVSSGEQHGQSEVAISPLARGEMREVTLALAVNADRVVIGRAIDAVTRAPIVGANVSGVRYFRDGVATRRSGGAADQTTTDAEGRFRLALHSWNTPYVRVEAPGYGWRAIDAAAGSMTNASELEIALQRTAKLRGRILDLATAPDSLRVRVMIQGEDLLVARGTWGNFDAWIEDFEIPASVRADGAFAFDDLPASTRLRFEALAGSRVMWRASEPLVLAPSETRMLDFAAAVAARRIRGRVVDQAGTPVATHAVWLVPFEAGERVRRFDDDTREGEWPRETVTDASGAFEFGGLLAGEWLVGPAPTYGHATQAVTPMPVLVVVGEGADPEPVEVRVTRGLYVRGRVVDAAGAPASAVEVCGAGVATPDLCMVLSDDDGRFVLGPLHDAEYDIWANPETDGGAESPHVRALPGAHDVALTITPDASIHGRVLPPAHGFLDDVSITLSSGDDSFGVHVFSAGSTGEFELDGLLPGSYTVCACDVRGNVSRPRTITLARGESLGGLELELQPGASVTVRYHGNAEEAGFDVFWDGRYVSYDDPTSSRCLRRIAVPSGEIRVKCRRWRRGEYVRPEIERTVEVGAGETKEIVFTDG
jgi:hypothetical protein